MMASFSLVGALEFREFVTSMTPHVAGAQLAGFEATPSPFAGGYYRRLSRGRTPLSRGNTTGERDPWDYALGGSLQLDHRAYSPAPDRLTQSLVVSPPEWPSSHTPTQHLSVDHMDGADSLSDFTLSVPQLPPRTKGQKIRHALHRAWEILFPTLRNFRAKSVPTKLASLFAVPAVLGLTLTLPVVVTSYHVPAHEPPISGHVATPLIQVEDEDDGIERAVMAEEEVQEEMHDHFRFNKWLTAAQCILGPLFVFEVIFGRSFVFALHHPHLLTASQTICRISLCLCCLLASLV
jgi:sodium/potassium/calcium exchanger 6